MNHNSVRVIVRVLDKKGYIQKQGYGYYVSTKKVLTVGKYAPSKVTEPEVRLHNLAFTFSSVGERGIVREIDYGLVTAKVIIASNGVANVYISCTNNPLDYLSYSILIACVKRDLKVPSDASVTVFQHEFNKDYVGLKLDGVKSMTLTAFDKSFERIYQKERNVLRREVRVNGKVTPETVEAILQGGTTSYNIMQSVAFLTNEIREELEAQKYTNRLLSDMVQQNKRLIDFLTKKEGNNDS